MLGLLGCGIFPPLYTLWHIPYTLHTCHYYIPPLFSLDELGLARLGVEAKAPATTVLATGRLDLAQAAGGNGCRKHPQLPGRLHLRGKTERLQLGTRVVDTGGLDCFGLPPGAALAVRVGGIRRSHLLPGGQVLQIFDRIVAAVEVNVIHRVTRRDFSFNKGTSHKAMQEVL